MADDVRTATRNAVVVMAAIAGGAAIYWLRDILTPLALAGFLAVMIDGFARVLAERTPFFPDRAALPLAVVLSIALFGGSVWVIGSNAADFFSQLVAYQPKLNALIFQAAGWVGLRNPPTMAQIYQAIDPASHFGAVASRLQGFASEAAFVLVYLGFILASRRGFRRKVVGMFPTHEERENALRVFGQIRDGVERYLWVQTVTGLMIAVGSGIVMFAVGLDNAVFWSFVIFLTSYIPVIGGFIGIMMPPIFALVQFDTWWQALTLFAVLNTIQALVGNIVLPRMQGESLNIDPVMVLLSLAFWGAIWGVPGMFLSTPLTVAVMVILAQFPATRKAAVLISANGAPQGVTGDPVEAKPAPTPPEVKKAEEKERAKDDRPLKRKKAAPT
ncbi:MAG: AI-2E family transporter [Parcubacteria group bacterium]